MAKLALAGIALQAVVLIKIKLLAQCVPLEGVFTLLLFKLVEGDERYVEPNFCCSQNKSHQRLFCLPITHEQG